MMRRPVRKHALPAALVEGARLPGYNDIRFWGDAFSPAFEAFLERKNNQIFAAAVARTAPAGLNQARCLAISGGGDKGAFAAGLLTGWSECGSRPVFEIVTGVSAGALAAPFAFLGTSEDHCLREIYTDYGAGELYKRRGILGFFSDALNDTARLDKLIRRYVTEMFLDRIAAEHAKGRRLLIMTTNLDAQRKVIWSLSGIAACNAPDRRELFAKVLRASSALPGLFPPVTIAVRGADGRLYEELHVDGGVAAELVFVPPEARIQEIEDRVFPSRRDRCLYVIENGTLVPEYNAVERKVLPLTLRAISTMVKFQVVDNLLALALIAKEHRQGFKFAAIPPSFDAIPKAAFDPAYARQLFEVGLEVGRGEAWSETPPVSPALAALLPGLSGPSAPSIPAGLEGCKAGAKLSITGPDR